MEQIASITKCFGAVGWQHAAYR